MTRMSTGRAPVDLRLRLLAEPCLWCWEIIDRRRGHAPLRSSWASEWTAYETAEEALAAGRARLSDLTVAGPRDARVANRRKGASAA